METVMKTAMGTVCALLLGLAVCTGSETRTNLVIFSKVVNPKSVRVRGDEPNVNVMFNFAGDAPKEIVEFERANLNKWIRVIVDGELVSEKVGVSGITGTGQKKVVGLDLIFQSKKEAARAAKLLRGEK